jgi:leucyl-tRNA synthetase
MSDAYDPIQIESRWRDRWESEGLYRSEVDWSRPKHYALTMLPYPSGDLHIGHWFAMTPSDTRARSMRMRGFDGFGLPAEQAAIGRNIHPKRWTYNNIERMRGQLRSMGTMFDWEREAVSCEPSFYKWTEWFFERFFANGLAYRGEAVVNWSPTLQTVLANEQVIDGKDERTGQPVEQKRMAQWFFRTTRYADELLDFHGLDWPEPIRAMQTNWIGRSEGARVSFLTEAGDPIEVYTTRPDTLWGATFMVLAPEHDLVARIVSDDQRDAVDAYVAEASCASEIERSDEKREKTGVFSGAYAVNPVNDARIPIWIADYVMLGYGSGAIMAVPAHDARDFEFARNFGLEVRPVIQPDESALDGATMESAYIGSGTMAASGPLDGIRCTSDRGRANPSIDAAIRWLEEQGRGSEAVQFRLRDWLISRQRYWGAPIPVIEKAGGGYEVVPEDQLPVELPDDVEFMPTGQSPLKLHQSFKSAIDSSGAPAERETDTMDTFVCSSWYQYRYLSPDFDAGPFDPEEAAYWLPVDAYTGGAEHANMHLLYTRFFTKAMRACGVFEDTEAVMKQHGRDPGRAFDEPMVLLRNQGQILGEERPGDTIAARGRLDGLRLVADEIQVIDDASDAGDDADLVGEIMSRTENVLQLRCSDGESRVVEATADTRIEIPSIPGDNDVNQLKHHLEIQRMSKSKGNVVNPDALVERWGADTVRAYLMFAFDWEKGGPWDSKGVLGVVRWLNDVWELTLAGAPEGDGSVEAERALARATHQTLERVTHSLENFSFNTAVAALMSLRNDLRGALRDNSIGAAAWHETLRPMLLMMAPITPHIAEELWSRLGFPFSIHRQQWPEVDPALLAQDVVTLAVQVNGKRRDEIQVPAEADEAAIREAALAAPNVRRHLGDREPRKVIVVPGRLVNIVA